MSKTRRGEMSDGHRGTGGRKTKGCVHRLRRLRRLDEAALPTAARQQGGRPEAGGPRSLTTDHTNHTDGEAAGMGGIPLALQGVLMYFMGVGGRGSPGCSSGPDLVWRHAWHNVAIKPFHPHRRRVEQQSMSNEADTCRRFVVAGLLAVGWDTELDRLGVQGSGFRPARRGKQGSWFPASLWQLRRGKQGSAKAEGARQKAEGTGRRKQSSVPADYAD